MSSELPSVTIEGAEHSLCIRYKKTPVGGTAAGSPWIQHDPATEEHLAAMLAALPDEQRERVLGPSRHVRHCSHSDYCPNCGYQVVRHK